MITGADGFIGRHLTKELVKEGIEIWAIIHPESKGIQDVPKDSGIHYIECTISNLYSRLSEFPTDIDVCYHLAWQGVNALERDDWEIQCQNIRLGFQCIEFATAIHIKRIIFPGSTNEYLYYGKPINQNAIPSAKDAYGSIKIALHRMAEYYTQKMGIEYIYVVLSGIYAADRRDNNVIFYTIDKLLNGEKPSLTKLEQLWDYVHIDDVVRALRLVGDIGKDRAFYVVGHGDNQPLYKYIYTIRDYINPSLPLGIGKVPYASEMLPSSCVDMSAVYRDTGYVPQISFEQGIKEVIDTMRRER